MGESYPNFARVSRAIRGLLLNKPPLAVCLFLLS